MPFIVRPRSQSVALYYFFYIIVLIILHTSSRVAEAERRYDPSRFTAHTIILQNKRTESGELANLSVQF